MSEKLSSYQKLKQENIRLQIKLLEVKMAIYNDAGSKLSQIKMEMHLKVGMSAAMWYGERDEFPPKQYDGIRSAMELGKTEEDV